MAKKWSAAAGSSLKRSFTYLFSFCFFPHKFITGGSRFTWNRNTLINVNKESARIEFSGASYLRTSAAIISPVFAVKKIEEWGQRASNRAKLTGPRLRPIPEPSVYLADGLKKTQASSSCCSACNFTTSFTSSDKAFSYNLQEIIKPSHSNCQGNLCHTSDSIGDINKARLLTQPQWSLKTKPSTVTVCCHQARETEASIAVPADYRAAFFSRHYSIHLQHSTHK